MQETTHIGTVRVRSSQEAAQRARLRLSAQLSGADLRPPGLAPSQVLLVRELADPEPGRLGLDNVGPMLDRTWERAVRDALAECLHRAVRPTNGRVPSDAEVILFHDVAEAWACWGREQVTREPSAAGQWWTESLESSSDAPSAPAGRSPSVAAVWRARPRLVPAMAAHLAAWNVAVEIVRQMSKAEAEEVLRMVCAAFDASPPPMPEAPADRTDEEGTVHFSAVSVPDEQRQTEVGQPDDVESPPVAPEGPLDDVTLEEPSPEQLVPEEALVPRHVPPWRRFVIDLAGVRLADALDEQPPAHRQLLGVALALQVRPATVRSAAFQSSWQAWRQAARRPTSTTLGGEQNVLSRSPTDSQDRSGEESEMTPARTTRDGEDPDYSGGRDRSSRQEESSPDENSSTEDDSSVEEDFSCIDDLVPSGDPRVREETTGSRDGEESGWEGAYTATDLGGVLYLVNVLEALELPASAETPPVGEHVGAWAVLETLARAMLGPDDDTLRPEDPLWRVLSTLDGRRSETPAGQALADAEVSSKAFRMPPGWLDAPHVELPLEGWWSVENDRLKVWTELGCVLDLKARSDPAEQAYAEWNGLLNTGSLERAESAEAIPLASEPDSCSPVLAGWAARTAPYVRYRVAAALGTDSEDDGWLVDVLSQPGKLYTTATHVDLMLPLSVARTDVRTAGLDRSPGWWAPGGRIVRFHFHQSDV